MLFFSQTNIYCIYRKNLIDIKKKIRMFFYTPTRSFIVGIIGQTHIASEFRVVVFFLCVCVMWGKKLACVVINYKEHKNLVVPKSLVVHKSNDMVSPFIVAVLYLYIWFQTGTIRSRSYRHIYCVDWIRRTGYLLDEGIYLLNLS